MEFICRVFIALDT